MNEHSIAAIARVCHEVNRAYCESIGDRSQTPWEEAPQWQVDSAINGVLYHLSNPNSTAAASHENWLKEKLADGWTYGPVKDPLAKTHPCIKPYNQLPLIQQTKDFLFLGVVRALEQNPPTS